ncbi:MAG: flavodoxin family protein [Candidatus Falkowbacteria bacterium]
MLKTDAELKKILGIDDQTLKRFKAIRQATIAEAKRLNKKPKKLKALGISGSARDEFDMAAEKSNSEFLLEQSLAELKAQGVDTELIPLRQYNIQHCKACYSTTNAQCHYPCSCYPKNTVLEDDMSKLLYDKILAADIIIFATPVNNFKMSSLMSLFLDRCISLDGSLAPADPEATKNKELNIKHTEFIKLMADDSIPGSGFLRRFSGKVAGVIVTGHEEGAALVISSLFMTLNHFGMIFSPWSNMYAMASISNPTYKDKVIVNDQTQVTEVKLLAQNTLSLARALRQNPIQWKYDNSAN